jgi:hypothetical protein
MRARNFLAFTVLAGLCASSYADAKQGSGFAVVDSSGALERGTATGASRSGTGTYAVEFSHSVKKCVFTATTGSTSVGAPPNGYVTVAGEGEDPNGVFVATFDPTGAPADLAFHLNVLC